MTFKLHTQLERDTMHVTDMGLCTVRLMDNKLFPWLILVPQRVGLSEWIDLEREEQHQLSDEIAIVSHIFKALVTPDKLNIAALGNQVPQLHIHVIGRYKTDSAWPNPVWGGPREFYGAGEADGFIRDIRMALDSLR